MDQSQSLRRQLLYAAALAAAACGTLSYFIATRSLVLPPAGLFVGFVLFTLFVLAMSFPSHQVGQTSLDRVAQISTLLIFGPLAAAVICATAYLIWPFLDRRKTFSLERAVMRALHNAAMFTFVILIGGAVYYSLDGPVPIRQLDWRTIVALIPTIIAMQLANQILMGVIALLNGLSYWRAFEWFSDLVEIAVAPLAVLAAIIYVNQPLTEVLLFLFVLLMLTPLIRRFALNRADLEKRVEQMTAINRLGQAVTAATDIDQLAELTFAQCRKLLDFSAFFLVLYDAKNRQLDFRLHHNEQGRQPRRLRPAGEGLIGWMIENNQPLLIENWTKAPPEIAQRTITIGRHSASWLGVPVTYHDRVLGAISVQNFVPDTFDGNDLDLMLTFAGQVGAAISNAQLFHELQGYKDELEQKVTERTDALLRQAEELRRVSDSLREANHAKEDLLTELQRKTEELDRQSKEDSLTGLYNRRYMDARLGIELERAQRFGRDITIAMADIDYFKNINDQCSHAIGDEVLRITAQILRQACRSIDIISRYGGEEFVLCFPETGIDGAYKVCEKIRATMATYDWESVHPGLKVTISIGVAGGTSCYEREMLQKSADKKLYEAKDAGRDRVCA